MLQALVWFGFFGIMLAAVLVFMAVTKMEDEKDIAVLFYIPVIFTGLWLFKEVIVFLWPYAMGVK
ncbi:hypothetical protein LCGC14_1709000 [marine sediment metagenome]|uniref:Uncharacterized protein n=1 Tax=marine sediment metagenome TaxID=412755 RepID=A0A0F9JW92_9ZZZZ